MEFAKCKLFRQNYRNYYQCLGLIFFSRLQVQDDQEIFNFQEQLHSRFIILTTIVLHSSRSQFSGIRLPGIRQSHGFSHTTFKYLFVCFFVHFVFELDGILQSLLVIYFRFHGIFRAVRTECL